MTQLDDAVSRYNRLLETEQYRDLTWAEALVDEMRSRHLTVGGRPLSPFLRPHFITRRQYGNLVKAAEPLLSAIDRVKEMALSTPALMARMELLPAEKMLAAVDPGYRHYSVMGQLGAHLENGTLHFMEYEGDAAGLEVYGETLSDLLYDCAPMKEFRKKHSLSKLGGAKYLLKSLLKTYKDFGGRKDPPGIAILEFRQPYQASEGGEFPLLRELFLKHGYPTEVVSPDQLEYRNGVLRKGNFQIDLIYRRVSAQEFLVRFDLSHALVRAYRDGAVCMVNSFRAELAQKQAIFDLLTDETITSAFPGVERKAIREFIPWTRVVQAAKTTYQEETVDLPDFILRNREKLVLKPNDLNTDQHSFRGWETDDTGWERALKTAMRTPYVVQEKVAPASAVFPMYRYGQLEMREMRVDVQPHAYLGKVQSCSSWVRSPEGSGFSTVSGPAATYVLESK